MSRHCSAAVIALVAIGLTGLLGLAQDKSQNLSEERGWGFGLQAPCVFSARYWVSGALAIEVNAFALTNDFYESPDKPPTSNVYGCVAGKLLYKIGDLNALDFYLGVWGELPFGERSPFRSGPEALGAALIGGLEWSLLPNFAVNFEFGEQARFASKIRVDFAFSFGMHYYFLRATSEEKK